LIWKVFISHLLEVNTSRAKADWGDLTRAKVSSTIAEIFIEDHQINVILGF